MKNTDWGLVCIITGLLAGNTAFNNVNLFPFDKYSLLLSIFILAIFIPGKYGTVTLNHFADSFKWSYLNISFRSITLHCTLFLLYLAISRSLSSNTIVFSFFEGVLLNLPIAIRWFMIEMLVAAPVCLLFAAGSHKNKSRLVLR